MSLFFDFLKCRVEQAERKVPENENFRKIFAAFAVPETQNETLIRIEADAKEPKKIRRLIIGVCRLNIGKNYILLYFKRQ